MSTMQDIQHAILASPGMTLRETAVAIGKTGRGDVTCVSALMSQLCKKQKLRRDSAMDVRVGTSRFWPTPLTGVDGRRKTETKASKAAQKRDAREGTAIRPRQSLPVQARKGYAKPTAAQQFAINPRHPPRPIGAARNAQTVDEFVKAGGVIQKLHPHASSNPLQFAHGDISHNRQGHVQRRKGGAL